MKRIIIVFISCLFINSSSLAQEFNKAEESRDPFEGYLGEKKEEKALEPQKKESVELPPPSLTIQGIIWGGILVQAIINNKVVKVGDTIEGARITDINKDGVTVFFGYRTYTLSSPAVINLQSLEKESEGGQDEKY